MPVSLASATLVQRTPRFCADDELTAFPFDSKILQLSDHKVS